MRDRASSQVSTANYLAMTRGQPGMLASWWAAYTGYQPTYTDGTWSSATCLATTYVPYAPVGNPFRQTVRDSVSFSDEHSRTRSTFVNELMQSGEQGPHNTNVWSLDQTSEKGIVLWHCLPHFWLRMGRPQFSGKCNLYVNMYVKFTQVTRNSVFSAECIDIINHADLVHVCWQE
jgi:hypothetical protein